MAVILSNIDPNEQESRIFDFLLRVHAWAGLDGDIRAVGGWVRDKLLGIESDDIDISLDGITGRQFEHLIREYSKAMGDMSIEKSFIVERRPEMSKHLETVGVKICGQKVDLVNLRSDAYGDTRIPTVQMGTPEEDAHRRDLTINSLFYNLNGKKVEDFTGRGLEDIRTGTLRTPLDPERTFLDDPLRMLRILRFFSRFDDSRLDTDGPGGNSAILMAMADKAVQAAYSKKVSPMRAGPELVKLLNGRRPAGALRLMFSTGLDLVVFSLPSTGEGIDLHMDQKSSYHSLDLLEHTLQVVENIDRLSREEGLADETRAKLVTAALFHDYGKACPGIAQQYRDNPEKMTYKGHEVESSRIADEVMRNIGIGDKDRLFTTRLIETHMIPHSLKEKRMSQRSIGRILRRLRIDGYEKGASDDPHVLDMRAMECRDMWKYMFMHGMADVMSKGQDSADDLALKKLHMAQFKDYLDSPPPTKPLLDGHAIMSIFSGLAPGRWISEVTDALVDAQDGRTVVTIDDAVAFVETMRPDIESRFGAG